jgi:Lhr-like helicases
MFKKNKLQPISNWLKKNGWQFYDHQLNVLKYTLKKFDVLLIAPTGGGKTLAGFLPPIYDLLSNGEKGKLNTLYISPLKALTTDVHRNLIKPIQDQNIDISVQTRTGDTPHSKRIKQKTNPPNMLMTTPESFALMMSDSNAEDFFSDLKFIVVDEVHNLINTKRGDLLALNLARIEDLAPSCQRLGLSATIKNKKIA